MVKEKESIDAAVASALLQFSPKLRERIIERKWYITMINIYDYAKRTKKQMVILDPETPQIWDYPLHKAHATACYDEYKSIPEKDWIWC